MKISAGEASRYFPTNAWYGLSLDSVSAGLCPKVRTDKKDVNSEPAASGGVRSVVTAILSGFLSAADNVMSILAMVALLFAGPLSGAKDTLLTSMLLGALFVALSVCLLARRSSTVGLMQELSIPVLALGLATTFMGADLPMTTMVPTAISIIGISGLITGVLFVVVGYFNLGSFVRFVPYPIVGGFLSSVGLLLALGTFLVVTGKPLEFGSLAGLNDPSIIINGLATIALALILLFISQHQSTAPLFPAVLILPGLLFYAVLWMNGISLDEARAQNFLPKLSGGEAQLFPDIASFVRVEWSFVATATPYILTAVLMNVLGLMLTVNGLETVLNRDLNVNRQFVASGIGNVFSGLVGASSGYASLTQTNLAKQMGVSNYGLVNAVLLILLVIVFFVGPDIVAMIPVFIPAGFLLMVGLGLLNDWLLQARKRLPFLEWLIIVAILLVVTFVGFLEGITVGLLFSIGVFVFNYARQPVIRFSADGTFHRSAVDRSMDDTHYLSEHAQSVEVLKLQGYLFFGTAERVVDHIKRRVKAAEKAKLSVLILDFKNMTGADSAAISCFTKIRRLADQNGFEVHLTRMPETVEAAVSKASDVFDGWMKVYFSQDIDHALEHAEDTLLARRPSDDVAAHATGLGTIFKDEAHLKQAAEVMDLLALKPGDTLIHAGEWSQDVFFLAKGRVKVQITLKSGERLRLRTMIAGAIVGEMALYLEQQRSADVIAEEHVEVYRLSRETLDRLRVEDPVLFALFQETLASNLAEKLDVANRMVQVAQD